MTTATREQGITRTSLIGIITNLLLTAFKAAVGMISGSISIVLDAVNNLTDAVSSIVTIVGVRLARKKPDERHPYGHGRVEYFSAIIVSGIVLFAGATALVESVKKIIEPETPDYSAASILIVAVAVVVKIILGRYVSSQGKKYQSEALVASGSDASFDAILSASTLVGIAIIRLFGLNLDGWIGAVLAVFIIKSGWEMLGESVSSVIGNRPDSEVSRAIRETVCQFDGVLGAYDLLLHDYGPEYAIGSIHIEIPADYSADQIHRLTRRISETVMMKYHVILTVGIYAIDSAHDEIRGKLHRVAMEHEGVLGTHAIYVDDEAKTMTIDVLTDFQVNRPALREDLMGHIAELLPGYQADINFDNNFAD
ncbi:MAG: cation transporter [Clostridia bacterium]|nr:cation transporter [Clostridia bacterium]